MRIYANCFSWLCVYIYMADDADNGTVCHNHIGSSVSELCVCPGHTGYLYCTSTSNLYLYFISRRQWQQQQCLSDDNSVKRYNNNNAGKRRPDNFSLTRIDRERPNFLMYNSYEHRSPAHHSSRLERERERERFSH